MCGIFAALSFTAGVSEESIAAGVAALGHRGPDGQRGWMDKTRRVGLGHARLRVIDLETGDQPLSNEDGRVTVVVNGELYDHTTVRAELEARGHRFATKSDSEILPHLWEDFGFECLPRLRGEFALVLWDRQREAMVAARDRFGVKPLYYATVGDRLYLASEAKALFAVGAPARWDHESFFQLCHLYYDQGRSLFHGVYQVPPGHYLVATASETRLVHYRDAGYPRRDEASADRTLTEHIARLQDALDEAVRLRLQADVPVACYLSGGIDSSTILALAARHRTEPIHAFTVGFEAEDYDESAAAAAMAEHVGARHHVLRVTDNCLADHFADAVWHSETINPNINGVAKYLLSKLARDAGFKVVLTGEGADEVAAGYEFLVRDTLLYGVREPRRPPRLRMLDELRGPGLPTGAGGVSTAAVRQCLGFVPSWIEWCAEAAVHSRSLWSSDFSAAFRDRDPYRHFLETIDAAAHVDGREAAYQSLYLWNKSMFANLLLNQLADRMEMAHGIEGRVPFLDDRVVEVLRDTPLSMKIRGGEGKHVLRQAARPFVTDAVYRRRKQAFLAPPSVLHTHKRLRQMLQDRLRGEAMRAVPFFDHAAIVRFLDHLPRRPDAADAHRLVGVSNQLVYLASASVMQERFALSA
jgi:asparagine synthase (glutamine-hydrolysing)